MSKESWSTPTLEVIGVRRPIRSWPSRVVRSTESAADVEWSAAEPSPVGG